MSRPSLRTAFKKCRSIEDTDQKLGYRFGAFQALGGTASLVSMLLLLACGANPVAPDAGSPDAGVSADGGLDLTLIEATVQPSKASAAADGQDRVELRVTLRRRGTGGAGSLGIPGVVIVFSGGGAGVAITQPTAATDPEGVATGFVASSSLGEKVITTTASIAGVQGNVGGDVRLMFTQPGPSRLVFIQQPPSGASGSNLAPAVRVGFQDALGRTVPNLPPTSVTLSLSANAGGATAAGTLTQNSADGIATFPDLRVDRAGAGYTLRAASGSLTPATSSAFDITAGPAASLAFVTPPLDAIAGEAMLSVRAEARDAAGNIATAFTGVIALSLGMNPTSTALLGTSRKNAVAGVADFTDLVVEKAAAGYTFNALADNLSPATSAPFDVFWTDAAALRLSGYPTTLTAGGTGALVVTAVDRFDNVVRDYTETVFLGTSDPQALIPPAITYRLEDEGRVTFVGLSLRTAGVHRIDATQRGATPVTGTSSSVVSPGVASRLAFLSSPANVTVRTQLAALQIALTDAFSNVVPTANASITLSLTPATGTLVGLATTDASNGIATFAGLQIENEGNGYTLQASAFSFAALASSAFNVSDNVPPSAPGTLDAIPLGERAVALSWTAPGDDGLLGTLVQPGAYYSLVVTGLGGTTFSRTVRSTDVGGPPPPAAQGTPQSFDVTGLEPGGQYRFLLTAIDGAGNVSAAAQTIETTLSCATGYAGLACTDCATGFHPDPEASSFCVDVCTGPNPCSGAPLDSCAAQVATQHFSPGLCTVTTPGQFTCDYLPTTVDCALTDDVCFQGACIPPPPTVLLSGLAATTTAGATHNVTASLRRNGATVTGYLGTLRITSTDPRATVDGNAVPFDAAYVGANAGSRTFVVVFKTASSTAHTLTLTDVALSLTTGTAASTVGPGAAAALTFVQQPTNGRVRVALSPAVSVAATDAFGNRTPGHNAVITVRAFRGADPVGASTEELLESGVATFAALEVNDEATGLVLRAAPFGSSFAPAVTSNPFTIVDDQAPGPVTDLHVADVGRNQSSLPIEWTAPGDDGTLGDNMTGSYVLAYSRTQITEANFAQATVVPTSAPVAQGFAERVVITGLDADTQYFVALRVGDAAGNQTFAFLTPPGRTAPCETGYTGVHCEACANGYVPLGPLCIPVCDTGPCSAPPANFCIANVATNHAAFGICAPNAASPFFMCDYVPTPTNCAATGGLCFGAGVCAPNPCASNPCTSVPATRCETDGLQRTTFASTCTPTAPATFSCAYPPTTTSCAPAVCFETQCVTATPPAGGELVISEVLTNPAAAQGEWFEVYNRTNKHLNLAGMTVEFGTSPGAPFTVAAQPPKVVAPGRYHVFGQSADRGVNGNVGVDTVYGTQAEFALLFATGRLSMSMGATLLDAPLTWDFNFPGLGDTGQSAQLSSKTLVPGAFHDKPWFWCAGSPPTPGAANGDCGINVTGPVEFCAIQFPDTMAGLATGQSAPIFGRVYKPHASTRNQSGNDEYPLIEVDLGYGAAGTAPTAWTQWTRATPNPAYGPSSPGFIANDDEYQANLSIPVGGNYLYGFRARFLDPVTGAPGAYVYCDQNNIANPASSGTYGTVTVTEPPRVLSARATRRTKAIVVFHKDIDASSVLANGTQFTFTGGLTVSAAAPVAGKPKEIELTTSSQGGGTSYTVTVAGTLTSGGAGVLAPNNTANITGLALCGSGSAVVISQLYGGGGGTSGTVAYKYDYVELHNRTAAAVTLNAHSLQQQSSTSAAAWTNRISLPAVLTLQPGQFYLVTTSGTTSSAGAEFFAEFAPTAFVPDLTSVSIALSATAGKVALASSTTLIAAQPNGCTSATPVASPASGSGILDMIGYGTTGATAANCAEGGAAAPTGSAVQAFRRGPDGCADTNNNSADYSLADPLLVGNRPRNASSPPVVCCDN